MENSQIESKLQELAKARRYADGLLEDKNAWQTLLEKTPEYQALEQTQDELSKTKAEIEAMTAEIKTAAVENDFTTEGLTIKNFAIVDYDPSQAVVWATETKQFSLLKLDTTQFNKVAKALDLDFVTKGSERRAQIATNLSFLLEGDPGGHG